MKYCLLTSSVRHLIVVLALCAVGSRTAVAQFEDTESNGKDAAYFALGSTALAGLPSVVPRAFVTKPTGMSFRTHAGFIDAEGGVSHRMLALGLDIPAGMGALGFTGGIADFNCDLSELEAFGLSGDCGSMYTASTSLSFPLLSSTRGSNSALVLGFDAALGYSTGKDVINFYFDDFAGGADTLSSDASALAASVGFPFAFVTRGGGIAFTPHLAPRVGYGRGTQKVRSSGSSGSLSEEITDDGVIFMLGGGVSVLFERSGVSVDVGFQKSFVKDANITMGLGFSYAPSR
ncbi:MAG TPA: hypothetical protein VM166_12545 [Gemmatimonadaceae bacterium]|nr:hypothetical protein [Gemmatimonadaceae bacterium]